MPKQLGPYELVDIGIRIAAELKCLFYYIADPVCEKDIIKSLISLTELWGQVEDAYRDSLPEKTSSVTFYFDGKKWS